MLWMERGDSKPLVLNKNAITVLKKISRKEWWPVSMFDEFFHYSMSLFDEFFSL